MIVSAIITEVRSIINEKTASNSHVTDAQILAWINECTLQLIAVNGTTPKATNTYTAANTITISEDIFAIDQAYIEAPDGKHSNLEPIDFANFVRMHPNWEDYDAAKPTTLVKMDTTSWMLYPYPNTDYLGKTITIIGKTLPTTITDTSKEPPMSQAWHISYVYYAASKCYLAMNQLDKAQAMSQAFDTYTKKMMNLATNTKGSLPHFSMESYW